MGDGYDQAYMGYIPASGALFYDDYCYLDTHNMVLIIQLFIVTLVSVIVILVIIMIMAVSILQDKRTPTGARSGCEHGPSQLWRNRRAKAIGKNLTTQQNKDWA